MCSTTRLHVIRSIDDGDLSGINFSRQSYQILNASKRFRGNYFPMDDSSLIYQVLNLFFKQPDHFNVKVHIENCEIKLEIISRDITASLTGDGKEIIENRVKKVGSSVVSHASNSMFC